MADGDESVVGSGSDIVAGVSGGVFVTDADGNIVGGNTIAAVSGGVFKEDTTPSVDIAPQRRMKKYIDWIKTEFLPLELTIPDETIEQQVENAIRYWNTNSGYRVTGVYDYPIGTKRIQLNAAFKQVVDVIPCQGTTWILKDHPMWTMLGITILDNITEDLIVMSEAFKMYRMYAGVDFHWMYEPNFDLVTDGSGDIMQGGYLYCTNLPAGAGGIFVTGTRRILPDEEITSQYILDWILRYSKALVSAVEGNVLRKAVLANVKTDGPEMVSEGLEAQRALKEELAVNSRWCAFARRR